MNRTSSPTLHLKLGGREYKICLSDESLTLLFRKNLRFNLQKKTKGMKNGKE